MSVDSPPLVCPECTQTFTRLSHLTRHVASKHVDGSGFVCKQCHGHFSRRDALKRHVDQYCRQSKLNNHRTSPTIKPSTSSSSNVSPLNSSSRVLQSSPTSSANVALVRQRNPSSLKACDHCSQRKLKCTGTLPCDRCHLEKRSCSFDRPTRQRWTCSTTPQGTSTPLLPHHQLSRPRSKTLQSASSPSTISMPITIGEPGFVLPSTPYYHNQPLGYTTDHFAMHEHPQARELQVMLGAASADGGLEGRVGWGGGGGSGGNNGGAVASVSEEVEEKIRGLYNQSPSQFSIQTNHHHHQIHSHPHHSHLHGQIQSAQQQQQQQQQQPGQHFDDSLTALMTNVAATSLLLPPPVGVTVIPMSSATSPSTASFFEHPSAPSILPPNSASSTTDTNNNNNNNNNGMGGVTTTSRPGSGNGNGNGAWEGVRMVDKSPPTINSITRSSPSLEHHHPLATTHLHVHRHEQRHGQDVGNEDRNGSGDRRGGIGGDMPIDFLRTMFGSSLDHNYILSLSKKEEHDRLSMDLSRIGTF